MTRITVRHGQLWADRDSREVKRGTRQRLRVIGLDTFGAAGSWQVHLNNEETGVDTWVRRDRMHKAFRLVEDPDQPALFPETRP